MYRFDGDPSGFDFGAFALHELVPSSFAELSELDNTWRCITCQHTNKELADRCDACDVKMCGPSARMLLRAVRRGAAGGAGARGGAGAAPAPFGGGGGGGGGDGGGGGGGGGGAWDFPIGETAAGTGSVPPALPPRAGFGGAAAARGAGARPRHGSADGSSGSGGSAATTTTAAATAANGGMGGKVARNQARAAEATARIAAEGAARGLHPKRPPCFNPVCEAGNRKMSHSWVDCEGEGGPREKVCFNPWCQEKGNARGHHFSFCYAPGGGGGTRDKGESRRGGGRRGGGDNGGGGRGKGGGGR
jgi:hypothetical protein